MSTNTERPSVAIPMEAIKSAWAGMKEKRVATDHLTITGTFHYSEMGEQPQSIPFGFEDAAGTVSEQLWQRNESIAESRVLDFGWIKNPGWLILKAASTNPETPIRIKVTGEIEIPRGAVALLKLAEGSSIEVVCDQAAKLTVGCAPR